MKEVIQSIMQVLSDADLVRSTGRWVNQFANSSSEDGFELPACFVEIQSVVWEQNSAGGQVGAATVVLHIGQENYYSSRLEVGESANALAIFDLLENIHNTVQGLEGTTFSKLIRTGSAPDQNFNHVIVDTITYQTQIFDSSEFDRNSGQPADADLNVNKFVERFLN